MLITNDDNNKKSDQADIPVARPETSSSSSNPQSQPSTTMVEDDENAPLLPPAYRPPSPPQLQSILQNRQERTSAPISGTAKPPRQTRFYQSSKFSWIITILCCTALVIGSIWAIPLIIKNGKNTGTWPEQPGAPNNPNGPDTPPGDDLPKGTLPWARNGSSAPWNPDWANEIPLGPLETQPFHCDAFSKPTHVKQADYANHMQSYTMFNVPLEADTLFFHAKAPRFAANVQVVQRYEVENMLLLEFPDMPKEKDDEALIIVQVLFEAGHEHEFDSMHTCQAGDGVHSAGVFITSEYVHPPTPISYSSYWVVYVVLPSSNPHGRLSQLRNFEIRTTNTQIGLGERLSDNVNFRLVDFQTTNGRIDGGSLRAGTIKLATTNGDIKLHKMESTRSAKFTTTNAAVVCNHCCAPEAKERPISWTIDTSNGAILGDFCAQQDINLRTTGGKVGGSFYAPSINVGSTNGAIDGSFMGLQGSQAHSAGLRVQTSNARITAMVAFNTGTVNSEDGLDTVPISIISTNGEISVLLENLPLTTNLLAQVATTNAEVGFGGHPNYQGSIQAATSAYFTVSVDLRDTPEGQPKRVLEATRGRGFLSGSIHRVGESKSDKGVNWGSIDLFTSNGAILAKT